VTLGVPVLVDNVAANEPTYGAADQNVRGEVLAAENTRETYAGREAIGGNLCEWAVVFRGDDGG